ncbi:hypothetical protein R1flu_002899 [Riccia fluitans]|uniref:Uncharacterized protein n=1 Tax=Riccia fluitans TaxID=41844 RepID=A0ABD1Y7F6_9MARC
MAARRAAAATALLAAAKNALEGILGFANGRGRGILDIHLRSGGISIDHLDKQVQEVQDKVEEAFFFTMASDREEGEGIVEVGEVAGAPGRGRTHA